MPVWLRDASDIRIPIGGRGVVLGRSRACGIVIDDPVVSRRHALVLADARGVTRLVPLDGVVQTSRVLATRDPTELAHGDAILIGRARFVVEVEPDARAVEWSLAADTTRYPLREPVVRVGGDPGDDVCIDAWPPATFVLHVGAELMIEAIEGATVLGGRRVSDEHDVWIAGHGSQLRHGAHTLALVHHGAGPPTENTAAQPSEISVEVLPSGAILRLRAAGDRTAFLPHRRADLLVALLSPLPPTRPGDWVDDATLINRVWGRGGSTRVQLNVLIHRTRQALTEAGIAGALLLQRAPGGGATRLHLDPSTKITVAS